MKKYVIHIWTITAALMLGTLLPACSSTPHGFAGTWNFDKSQSKDVGAFFESGEMRYMLKIVPEGKSKIVIKHYTSTEAGWNLKELHLDLNGPETTSTFPRGDLYRFSFEAVAIGPDQTITAKAVQGSNKNEFDVALHYTVLVSQGTYNIVEKEHYQLSPDGNTLTITETRNSRQLDEPAVYVFHRAK